MIKAFFPFLHPILVLVGVFHKEFNLTFILGGGLVNQDIHPYRTRPVVRPEKTETRAPTGPVPLTNQACSQTR